MKIIKIHIVILLSLLIFTNCKKEKKDLLKEDPIKIEGDWIVFGKMPLIWQIWRDDDDRVWVWITKKDKFDCYIQIYTNDFIIMEKEFNLPKNFDSVLAQIKRNYLYVEYGPLYKINNKGEVVNKIYLKDFYQEKVITLFDIDSKGNIYVRIRTDHIPETGDTSSYFCILNSKGSEIFCGAFNELYTPSYTTPKQDRFPISHFHWFYYNGYIYDYFNTVKKVSLETYKSEVLPFKSQNVKYFRFFKNYYIIIEEREVKDGDKYYYKLQLYSKDFRMLKESNTYKFDYELEGKFMQNRTIFSAALMNDGTFYIVDSENNRILRIP
ncbi:MAG: hypothetical protein SVR08_16230, partial [Spirochaetota bacterium]|nr:hypothetical protein [Spirochaetota bacterium]